MNETERLLRAIRGEINPKDPNIIDVIPEEVEEETKETYEEEPEQQYNKERAQKEVTDFITEMDLGPFLTKEFETLNNAQKLKIIRDLKRRIVDLVKSDAQTQYSEDIKEKGAIAKIRTSLNKESETKNFEIKAFETIKNTEEGKKLIVENLAQLTEMTKDREVSINNNKLEIAFINPDKASSEIEKIIIINFNTAANNFRKIPYEWSQEKAKLKLGSMEIGVKHRKEYEKTKAEYEKARNELLKIKENEKGKGSAIIEFLQLDNLIKMDQLINTHPEFEAELAHLSKNEKSDNWLAQGKDVLNMAGGKGAINKAIFAGGYGARWLSKSLAFASGVNIMTGVATVAVGGVIGGIRGRFRGKETLEERQKEARHGKKDTSKEKIVTTDATHLNKRLEKLIQEIKNTTNKDERKEEHAEKLSMLSVRIEHTLGKIEKGQVNFGDSKSSLVNEYNLVNNLNEALVLRETMSEKTNVELKTRINLLLARKGSNLAEKTSEAQREFIYKQTRNGALLGAGLATAGYALRYVGEHLGWWGVHGNMPKSGVAQPDATGAPKNFSNVPPTTSPESANVATPETLTPPNANAVVYQGQGVEHTFIKQIDANPKLAEQLGFKGDTSDTAALHKFAGQEAHKIADKMGYIGENGQEVRITEANKIAFELKVENGHPVVIEKTLDGKIIETYDKEEGYEFGKNPNNQYEKISTAHHQPEQVVQEHHTTPPTEPEKVKAPSIKTADQIEKEIDDKFNEAEKLKATQGVAGTEKPNLANNIKTPHLGSQVVHVGTAHEIGTKAYTGNDVAYTGSEAYTGGNYYGNQTSIFNGERYYLNEAGQFHDAYGKPYFPELTTDENVILQKYPVFADNPFNLPGKELIKAYDASLGDMNHLFGNEPATWSRLGALKATKILEYTNETNIDATTKRFSDYLNLLKNFSELKPKAGFLGVGTENSGHYICRALQKLVADGKLEIFEESLRK